MKKLFFLGFIILTVISPLANNYALNDSEAFLDDPGDQLKVYLGEPKIIPVSNPTRIVIANPNILDVYNVTTTEMTLNPKAVGSTSLIFWDNFGEQNYRVLVVSENLDVVKDRIDSILRDLNANEVYCKVADEENKVLLLGDVKNKEDKERISLALGSLKDKVIDLVGLRESETTVEIDVQILELDTDATKTLGFTWPGSVTLTDVSSPTTVAKSIGNAFIVNQFTRGAFTFKLDTLIQEGKARILSRPRISCQSGKEAQLLVGGEKPILTTTVASTTGAQGTQVEYKEFGIKLKIKPVVMEDRSIKLGLNVEVSDVGDAVTLGTTAQPTALAYPLTKRTTSTELFLKDGQAMAIGGLIKQKSEEDLRKFPWLADVPVLGAFFRQRVTKTGGGTGSRGNVELFVTLTPRITAEDRDAARARLRQPTVSHPPVIMASGEPTVIYSQIIQKRILDNLSYPALAKEAGFQGTVNLGLLLSYQGQLVEAKVKDSSGYKLLDDNTVNTAKAIAPYPPFPATLDLKEIWLDIPIEYRLD